MSFDSQRVEEIVSKPRGMTTAEERAAYLDATCGADAALRAWVEALLKAREQAATMASDATTGPETGERRFRRPSSARNAFSLGDSSQKTLKGGAAERSSGQHPWPCY